MADSTNTIEGIAVEDLVLLRAAVAYLGEAAQYGWWQSGFFSAESAAFLGPIFPRTKALAQCTGATAAAALVHDEHIGVGQVYHLFRLPEDLEHRIHAALHDPDLLLRVQQTTADQDAGLVFLRHSTGGLQGEGVGPVRAGSTAELRGADAWKRVAAIYLAALQEGPRAFPYFTDRA
jgi:hypothetical protein